MLITHERDPLNNPQPGDIIRAGNRTRKIVRRDDAKVYFVVVDAKKGVQTRETCTWLVSWCEWCQNRAADVVEKAP